MPDQTQTFVPSPMFEGWGTGGSKQFGQYTLVRVLGRGGWGIVFEAQHTRLKRRVALKTISLQRLSNDDSVARFRREMELIGQLHHPHIVLAHDAGEISGMHYLAMEYVDGLNLSEVLKSHGMLPIAEACEIARQAAVGLAYAHANGLIHRDVKPSNLLMGRDGTVKVADLGLARFISGDGFDERLTVDGRALGTVNYMSPEQVRGEPDLDCRTDLYSLGCTLFEFLTGRAPFAGPEFQTSRQKLNGHESSIPPRVHTLRPEVPEELDRLVARLLEKRREDRPQSAVELADALALHAVGASTAALLTPAVLETLVEVRADLPAMPDAGMLLTSIHERTDPQPRPNPVSSTQLSGTGQTVSLQTFRRTLLAISVLVCVAIATALYGLWMPGRNPPVGPDATPILPLAAPAPTEHEPVYQELAADEIIPQRWYPLFRQEPSRLLWPEDGGMSALQFHAGLEQVTVTSFFNALLSLGRPPPSDRFRVELDVGQSQWSGNVGFFWGYHQLEGMERDSWEFQTVRLNRTEGKRSFLLARTHNKLLTRPDGGVGADDFTLRSVEVPIPAHATERLEMRFVGGDLKELRWGGLAVPDLCRSAIQPDLGLSAAGREFGLYCGNGGGLFRSARVMAE